MSLDTKKNSPRGNGVSHGITFTNPGPPCPADLESVCRSVAELARSAPNPPSRIKLQHGSTTVEMEWPDPVVAPLTAAETASPEPAAEDRAAVADEGRSYLCAPMVGTFYHAREPGSPPLVAVGDLVRPGQVVGILEVMKMMSTVEADVAGRVVEILVPDARPVEFHQRLIAVEPVGEDG